MTIKVAAPITIPAIKFSFAVNKIVPSIHKRLPHRMYVVRFRRQVGATIRYNYLKSPFSKHTQYLGAVQVMRKRLKAANHMS